ncbi:MAG: arylsulfatase [Bacteroidota bacterium]
MMLPALRTFLLISFGLLICCQSPKPAAQGTQPNIIVILGDDMGYSDLGCFGGEIRTPHLDHLAANGLRFTQFYNTGRCCPTRASLLTGLYPQQAGIGHMVNDRGTAAYRGDLSFQAVTIAEVLKTAGYQTYLSGKWHVTPFVGGNPPQHNWPLQRGFDRFFGMMGGAGSFYDPRGLAKGNRYIAPEQNFYATTAYTQHAISFIEQNEAEKPFFLYLAHQAGHWPLHAPQEAIDQYKGHYDKGWDSIRTERFDRMKSLGLIEPEWEMTPRDSLVAPWDPNLPDKAWQCASMETYAAMISLMDEGIGQIIQVLKERDQLDNTLIFFLQDNGACAEELGGRVKSRSQHPPSSEPMQAGAFQTETVPPVTRDGQVVRLMKEAWPGPPEGYTAYGRNWANASNTPFREYKHWVHEGGIATPLIVHWPEKIQSSGEMRKTPTHLIDIMATCIEAAGATYPIRFADQEIIPLEGKSLLPAFTNNEIKREAIFWEHEGNRAVRMGKWKLISKANKHKAFQWDQVAELAEEDWELFDMETDRTEMNDLAAAYPARVLQMAKMWMNWAEKVGAVPRPKP